MNSTHQKKIELLYLYHAGANCQYFETMLRSLEGRGNFSYDIIRPAQISDTDMRKYNVLVYQTFPDNTHPGKYNPDVIARLDEVFIHFDGFKILLDSFDMGNSNGFERFGREWPRIKHVPSYNYIRDFDVISILCTTGWQQKKYNEIPPEIIRVVSIHCAFTVGVYPHKIRESIMEKLKSIQFSHYVNFERIPTIEYNEFLRKVQISVVSTGFGETSGNAYPTLQSGALLFVHEKIREVKLLPFVDLVDGEDYVSFNLENFVEKLNWALMNAKERRKIQMSGQKKFFEGFDPERSSREFLKYLKENVF